MNALAGDVTEGLIDHSLAINPALANEGCTFNLYGEMRFARAIIA